MEFIVKRKSSSDSELKHYGIKGQTWGVRNYQYEDGSYTPAGKKRYSENRGSSKRSAVPKTRSMTKNVSRASQKQLSNEQIAALTAKSSQDKLIEDQVKEELARKLKDKGITVDPSKVSKEYLMEMASNSGIDVSAVSRIEDFLKSDNKPVQVSGESLSKGIDYDQLQKNMNDALSRQDELIGQFKKEQEEAEKKVAEGVAKTREMTPSNVSPEYLRESAYNAMKNVYPSYDEDAAKEVMDLAVNLAKEMVKNSDRQAATKEAVDATIARQLENAKARQAATKEAVDATIARQLENAKAKEERKETSRRSKTSEGSSRKSMMQSDRNVFYISRDGDPELQHYGILGMKWGVRRYQNPDGSLTTAGERRYNTGKKEFKRGLKADRSEAKRLTFEAASLGEAYKLSRKASDRANVKYSNNTSNQKAKNNADAARETRDKLKSQYDEAVNNLEKHRKEMSDKYGENSVSQVRMKADKKTGEQYVNVDKSTRVKNNLVYGSLGFWLGAVVGVPVSVAVATKIEPEYVGAKRFVNEYNSTKADLANRRMQELNA